MNLREIGWGGVDWIGQVDKRRALVNAIMNLRVSQNAAKLLSNYTTAGLSRSAQLHIIN
jgi:hypothetical protein